MPTRGVKGVLGPLRRAALLGAGSGMTDGQLLGEFLARRDDAAFTCLVRRHGPMVFGVCRRLLRHRQDAEDAFQATLLVLARKAASVQPREQLGNWLYGVAYRTALEARRRVNKRRARERQVEDLPHPSIDPDEGWQDLWPVLDEELSRLPDKFRLPIVLCDLEGRTRKEVARQLRLPEGTLSNRLAAARRLLAKQLTRRGVTLSGGALAVLLAPNTSSAAAPMSLVSSMGQAAASVAGGGAATPALSAGVVALAEGVIQTMFLTNLKKLAALALMAAVLVFTAGGVAPTGAIDPTLKSEAADQAGKAPPKMNDVAHLYLRVAVERDGRKVGAWIIRCNSATGDWKKILDDANHVVFGRVSPDGTTFAFPKDGEVWQCDAKTGDQPVRLAKTGSTVCTLCWAPDGASLIISHAGQAEGKGGPRYATRKLSVDRKTLAAVPLPPTYTVDDWSRNGEGLAATGPGGVALFRLDGKERVGVAAGSSNARYSPDGKRIAYDVQHLNEIRVGDADGKNDRACFRPGDSTMAIGPCWSPDGKRIACALLDFERDAKGKRYIPTPSKRRLAMVDVKTGKDREFILPVRDGYRIRPLEVLDWR